MANSETETYSYNEEAERRFNEIQALQNTKFTSYDQIRTLPPFESRVLIATDLHNATLTALAAASVEVIDSYARTKTDERIRDKARTGLLVWQWWPLRDIYGVRLVVADSDVLTCRDVILETFLKTDDYPYKVPNVIDYNDPSTKRPREMHPDYRAIHIAVAFGGQVLPPRFPNDPKKTLIPYLGEIQIFNPEQKAIEMRTRSYYVREQYRPRRKRNSK